MLIFAVCLAGAVIQPVSSQFGFHSSFPHSFYSLDEDTLETPHRQVGKIDRSGSMYKLFSERKNWDDAEAHCQSLDAHLAVVDNQTKNDFVTGLLSESRTSDLAWIGMKTKTTSMPTSFTNFAAESPIDGCAVIDKSGVWSIRSCIQLRPFICQIVKA
ncbi:unnamed protein product [Caenorhabditis auriculariae]|uniref:C-type lectin domain-containing protein n=1 Tax=Caenorhabditis auriculariae TaxID=2777116 RepID=A0A8S1HU00_9PELO|nr:unnamed protein product [Caenorhabditis auriculariae]